MKFPDSLKNNWKDLLSYIVDDIYDTDFWGICTQMAFFFLLAFFPMIIFLVDFGSRFLLHFKQYLYDLLQMMLPNLSFNYVVQLTTSLEQNNGGDQFLLPVASFIFASLGAHAIITGINQNYRITENRRPITVIMLSFLITILFGVAVVCIIVAYLILSGFATGILTVLGLQTLVSLNTQVLTFFFSLAVLVILFDGIYALAPARRTSFQENLPGAILATLGVSIVLRIFVIFANHSNRYTLLYGNWGGLFALLVLIYFFCVILNIGSKFNLYLQELQTVRKP
jgi:membrane protein